MAMTNMQNSTPGGAWGGYYAPQAPERLRRVGMSAFASNLKYVS